MIILGAYTKFEFIELVRKFSFQIWLKKIHAQVQ